MSHILGMRQSHRNPLKAPYIRTTRLLTATRRIPPCHGVVIVDTLHHMPLHIPLPPKDPMKLVLQVGVEGLLVVNRNSTLVPISFFWCSLFVFFSGQSLFGFLRLVGSNSSGQHHAHHALFPPALFFLVLIDTSSSCTHMPPLTSTARGMPGIMICFPLYLPYLYRFDDNSLLSSSSLLPCPQYT